MSTEALSRSSRRYVGALAILLVAGGAALPLGADHLYRARASALYERELYASCARTRRRIVVDLGRLTDRPHRWDYEAALDHVRVDRAWRRRCATLPLPELDGDDLVTYLELVVERIPGGAPVPARAEDAP